MLGRSRLVSFSPCVLQMEVSSMMIIVQKDQKTLNEETAEKSPCGAWKRLNYLSRNVCQQAHPNRFYKSGQSRHQLLLS